MGRNKKFLVRSGPEPLRSGAAGVSDPSFPTQASRPGQGRGRLRGGGLGDKGCRCCRGPPWPAAPGPGPGSAWGMTRGHWPSRNSCGELRGHVPQPLLSSDARRSRSSSTWIIGPSVSGGQGWSLLFSHLHNNYTWKLSVSWESEGVQVANRLCFVCWSERSGPETGTSPTIGRCRRHTTAPSCGAPRLRSWGSRRLRRSVVFTALPLQELSVIANFSAMHRTQMAVVAIQIHDRFMDYCRSCMSHCDTL